MTMSARPKVLQLGEIEHASETWAAIAAIADIVVPHAANRAAFLTECHAGRFDGVVAAYHTFASGAQTGRIDAELLAALPTSLRFVCHNGAGYDQIDVAACTARGILVSHTPHAVDEATADLHIFLMLGALRNLGPVMATVRRGEWRGSREITRSTSGRGCGLLGHDPRGKILGILGMGGIGRTVARKAHAAFGMHVRYYNRRRLPAAVEQSTGDAEYVSFDRLLAESDVLSVNVPLNAQTRHLLGAAEFARMKPGSVVVNTARGAVLDEAALVEALESGPVAAAGLDVFEHEPAVHPGLLANERVVLVPHMGTATVETERQMEEMAMANVRAGVEQGRLLNVVPEQGEEEEEASHDISSNGCARLGFSGSALFRIVDPASATSSTTFSVMASRPARPTLTPQFCFNTVVLRDFLRTSRAVDDAITQHLNALVTPSRAGFDPASTATRSYPSVSAQPSSSSPSDPACRAFRDAVLFPAWQARDDVIQYCEAVVKQSESQTANTADDSDSTDDSDPRHSERYDPYIRRRRFSEVEPQTDRLAALMRQERVVETIVRARSWDVLQGRCGAAVVEAGTGSTGWEAALERWKRR